MKDGDDSDYVFTPIPVYKSVLLAVKCALLFYLLGEGMYRIYKKKDKKFRPIIFLLACHFIITLMLLLEEFFFDYIYLVYYIFAFESIFLVI